MLSKEIGRGHPEVLLRSIGLQCCKKNIITGVFHEALSSHSIQPFPEHLCTTTYCRSIKFTESLIFTSSFSKIPSQLSVGRHYPLYLHFSFVRVISFIFYWGHFCISIFHLPFIEVFLTSVQEMLSLDEWCIYYLFYVLFGFQQETLACTT